MMTFLAPGFAWAFLIPAAIVVLYLLRRRYTPRNVPSTFLWQRSVRDHAANHPFQKLRRNLLLPLQLLPACFPIQCDYIIVTSDFSTPTSGMNQASDFTVQFSTPASGMNQASTSRFTLRLKNKWSCLSAAPYTAFQT